MSFVRICVLALSASVSIPAALADPAPSTVAAETPDVATLLFETPQWAQAPAGTSLTYGYSKKADAAFGPSFDDRIALTLEKGGDPQSRTVDVKMFSGEHTKPAGPFESDQQNPILVLALEANIEDLTHAWHGNPRYLKDAVRKAWRDDAKIEKTQIEVAGKSVPGTRITIEPFKDDPEKDKMMGLETMVYTVEIADGVPGQIALVDIHAPASGPARFAEILRYQSATLPAQKASGEKAP